MYKVWSSRHGWSLLATPAASVSSGSSKGVERVIFTAEVNCQACRAVDRSSFPVFAKRLCEDSLSSGRGRGLLFLPLCAGMDIVVEAVTVDVELCLFDLTARARSPRSAQPFVFEITLKAVRWSRVRRVVRLSSQRAARVAVIEQAYMLEIVCQL